MTMSGGGFSLDGWVSDQTVCCDNELGGFSLDGWVSHQTVCCVFFLQDKVKAAFKRGWIAGQKKIKSEDGENGGWGKLGE